MSKRSEELERKIEELGEKNKGQRIPGMIPDWMVAEGIAAGTLIEGATRTGASNSKTDVMIKLLNSENIKISAKLNNADYFGNWYGHERIVKEFGVQTFEKLAKNTTDWANQHLEDGDADDVFVGVSISFGKRTGNTKGDFTSVFEPEDVVKIVKGVGDGQDVANALFIADGVPDTVERLITYLQKIDVATVKHAIEEFKIVYRPVYPRTNDSNRGKCTYTRFEPFERQKELVRVESIEQLRLLGHFVPVDYRTSYKMNHNKVIEILRDCYNIEIPVKNKS